MRKPGHDSMRSIVKLVKIMKKKKKEKTFKVSGNGPKGKKTRTKVHLLNTPKKTASVQQKTKKETKNK